MKTLVSKTLASSVIAALTFLAATGPSVAMPQSDTQKTSDDQKNNKDDVQLTASIRKAILADKTLSVAAHNVKIITRDGMVTLAGRLESDGERAAVVAKAREIAGAQNVTDQLTLAPSSK